MHLQLSVVGRLTLPGFGAWPVCGIARGYPGCLPTRRGATVAEILVDFPTLTEPAVRAVIAFAAASAEEDLPVPAVPQPA